jgi:hypothetical protein
LSDTFVTREEFEELKQQFDLLVAHSHSTYLTVQAATNGRMIIQQSKPGLEHVRNDIPIHENVPLYRFQKVNVPRMSRIVDRNGESLPGSTS